MSGFGRLAEDYDGFVVDLWGVVHDGVKPLPGALDCLARLRAMGKRVVFLSNAPRCAAGVARILAGMGIGPEFYDGIMSSGEAVHLALAARAEPEFQALGCRLYHLGPARDRDVFDTLDLVQVDSVEDADFILNTGPDDRADTDPALYAPVLEAARAGNLAMVCANPDLEVMRGGTRVICAGALARDYAAMGGRVIMRGKPDAAIYAPTLAMLGTAPARTLAVGDSLRTDMAGAKAAGFDACWVLSGIHALHPDAAPAEAAAAAVSPVAILVGFSW